MPEEERKRGRQNNQKMKAYLVMRLLQKNTDFDHLMTSTQIAELLNKSHQYFSDTIPHTNRAV